jgi:hypothetical protein
VIKEKQFHIGFPPGAGPPLPRQRKHRNALFERHAEIQHAVNSMRRSSMTKRIKSYRYETVHNDDGDFIAYQRSSGGGVWQTVSVWMIPQTACH